MLDTLYPVITLEDIVVQEKHAIVDGPFGSSLKTSDYVEDGIPVLQGKNITNFQYNFRDIRYISEAKADELSRSKVTVGDILFVKIGSIGYSAEMTDLDGYPFAIIPANMAKATIDENKMNKRFLLHWLRSETVISYLKNSASKTAQPALSLTKIKKIPVILPPFEDQKKIADILDRVQLILEKRKEVILNLDELVRVVFLDMFGVPSHNPKGFPKGTIRQLVSEAKYGTSKKANEGQGEFPYIRMNNITFHGYMDFSDLKYIDLDLKEQEKYLVEKGDLLFNRTNSKDLVGKTAVFEEDEPMAIAGYIVRVRTNDNGNPYYISGYLNSNHGKLTLKNMCKNIVGMANINAQEMQDIEILIPPKKLQDIYEGKYKLIMKKRRQFEKQLSHLEDLFQSLRQKAFKGKLEINTELVK